MSYPSKLRGMDSIVEPPRDGEFFFDETVDEPVERASLAEQFSDLFQHNPVVSLGTAVALGALITSIFLM